jgi:hypothetical protein
MSNREIAEQLVISKRTADSHVEHILNKLGCSRRGQIAAFLGSAPATAAAPAAEGALPRPPAPRTPAQESDASAAGGGAR